MMRRVIGYTPIHIAHKLYEASGGSSSRPPVIFLHGLMERKETWQSIPQRLADATHRKVYTFDARNHGESEHTMESSFDWNVYDLYYFMDKMKIDRTILVGHNMGGMTAIRAALQEPIKIQTAFIVDMHADRIPQDRIHQYMLYMRSCAIKLHQTPKDSLKPNLARVRFPPPLEKLQEEGLFRSVMTYRLLAIMDALMDYDNYPIVYRGVYLDPIYFIYGSESPYYIHEHTANIYKHFPKAEMLRFEGASSNLYLEFSDEFVNMLHDKIPKPLLNRLS